MKAFHEVRNFDPNCIVWHASYENIGFLAHWHKEIELIYIREGTVKIRVDHTKITANAGDLIICDSGQIHDSVPQEEDNSIDFIIFDTGILGKIYEGVNFETPLITKEELSEHNLTEELNDLFTVVFREMKEKSPYYQEIVKSSLKRFWFLLKRYHPAANTGAEQQSARSKLLYDLHELLSYMDAHYAEPIPLEVAANKMNLSVYHFSKMFKKLMGIPYVTYLNMIRVEHASEQMKQTGKKLLEIALNNGFNNIRTFNRVFKQITGYTPSEFCALREPDIYAITYHRYRSGEERFTGEESVAVIQRPSV